MINDGIIIGNVYGGLDAGIGVLGSTATIINQSGGVIAGYSGILFGSSGSGTVFNSGTIAGYGHGFYGAGILCR